MEAKSPVPDSNGLQPAPAQMRSLRNAKATLPASPLSVTERCLERRHRAYRQAESVGVGGFSVDLKQSSRPSSATTRSVSSGAPDASELLVQIEELHAIVFEKDRQLEAKDEEILALRRRVEELEQVAEPWVPSLKSRGSLDSLSTADTSSTSTTGMLRSQRRRQILAANAFSSAAGALRRRKDMRAPLGDANAIAEEVEQEEAGVASPSTAKAEDTASAEASTAGSTPSSPSKPWSLVRVLPKIEAMLLGKEDPDEVAEESEEEFAGFWGWGDEEYNVWGEDDTVEAKERRLADFFASYEAADAEQALGLRPRVIEPGRTAATARRMAQRRHRALQRRKVV